MSPSPSLPPSADTTHIYFDDLSDLFPPAEQRLKLHFTKVQKLTQQLQEHKEVNNTAHTETRPTHSTIIIRLRNFYCKTFRRLRRVKVRTLSSEHPQLTAIVLGCSTNVAWHKSRQSPNGWWAVKSDGRWTSKESRWVLTQVEPESRSGPNGVGTDVKARWGLKWLSTESKPRSKSESKPMSQAQVQTGVETLKLYVPWAHITFTCVFLMKYLNKRCTDSDEILKVLRGSAGLCLLLISNVSFKNERGHNHLYDGVGGAWPGCGWSEVFSAWNWYWFVSIRRFCIYIWEEYLLYRLRMKILILHEEGSHVNHCTCLTSACSHVSMLAFRLKVRLCHCVGGCQLLVRELL